MDLTPQILAGKMVEWEEVGQPHIASPLDTDNLRTLGALCDLGGRAWPFQENPHKVALQTVGEHTATYVCRLPLQPPPSLTILPPCVDKKPRLGKLVSLCW